MRAFEGLLLPKIMNSIGLSSTVMEPYGLSNDEVEKGPAIHRCQQPHGTGAQLWPELAHLG